MSFLKTIPVAQTLLMLLSAFFHTSHHRLHILMDARMASA
jgi:hypothetical protein